MSLVVLTGAVRSGKSSAAEQMAASRGYPVVIAVAGWSGDEEMARRIEAHRASRPAAWETRVIGPEPSWIGEVPEGHVLVLDCLATLVGAIAWDETGDSDVATAEQEANAARRAEEIVASLARRPGDTIVVTNEAGWGVIPPTAAGRLFRDILGRMNRELVAQADAAYLVVAGRFIDLKDAAETPRWPEAASPEMGER